MSDGAFFLKVLDRFSVDSNAIERLKPSVESQALVIQMTSEATDAAFSNGPEARLEKLSSSGLKFDWSPLIEAAIILLENPSARDERSILSAVEVLGRIKMLSPSKSLNEKLKALSQGGLLDCFYEMHSQGKHEAEVGHFGEATHRKRRNSTVQSGRREPRTPFRPIV
jgi:hypothetical protein